MTITSMGRARGRGRARSGNILGIVGFVYRMHQKSVPAYTDTQYIYIPRYAYMHAISTS